MTLERMADGGIHDQVGGGFHRYSVDAIWLVPHFEKMLYDNALLARVYALAHRVTGEQRWREVAERTLDYLLREMQAPDGGFAAAQDADSPGGEGAFFVWSVDQLREVLSHEEAQAVVLRYGVRPEGNFEGCEHPERRRAVRAGRPARRPGRPAPGGVGARQAVRRPVRASGPGPRRQGRDGVERARDRRVRRRRRGARTQRTTSTWRAERRRSCSRTSSSTAASTVSGRAAGPATWAASTTTPTWSTGCSASTRRPSRPRWLTAARDLADRMIALFADPDGAGFYYAGADAEALIARTRDLEDHPTPGGNSQAALVLLRLGALTGDAALTERAHTALCAW